ncbi:MAG: MmgE/PrpD family protein [Acidimicrobiia bacterium]
MTVAQTLATWALDLEPRDVPSAVRHAATRHIADGIGNALAARRLHEADFALALAARFAANPPASIIGGGDAGIEGATFANGVLIHALDYDDTHPDALIHVTAAALPAAMACTEAAGGSIDDLITTTIVGYEIAARIGMATPHGFHRRGFHATSVVGALTAAFVAARATGLSPELTVASVGIAGSMSSGSLEFLNSPASTKQIHPGWSGMAGVMAANLAKEGATGPGTILEGTNGILALFSDTPADLSAITAELGTRWETERISIKPYPVCQLSHASLDAARTLPPIDPSQIARVEVVLPEDAEAIVAIPTSAKLAPRSSYEAKFSVQWDVATLLIDGEVGVDAFTETNLTRGDIKRLAEIVEVTTVPFDRPPANAPGHIIVHTRDGNTFEGTVPQSRGSVDAPLSDDAVYDKLVSNTASEGVASTVQGLLANGSAPVSDLLAATTLQGAA